MANAAITIRPPCWRRVNKHQAISRRCLIEGVAVRWYCRDPVPRTFLSGADQEDNELLRRTIVRSSYHLALVCLLLVSRRPSWVSGIMAARVYRHILVRLSLARTQNRPRRTRRRPSPRTKSSQK